MKQENMPMGPHDLGGEEAGPIDTIDHGMSHWEKHANALRMTVTGIKLGTLDEMRRAAEDLGDRYKELSYFEKQSEMLGCYFHENFLYEVVPQGRHSEQETVHGYLQDGVILV